MRTLVHCETVKQASRPQAILKTQPPICLGLQGLHVYSKELFLKHKHLEMPRKANCFKTYPLQPSHGLQLGLGLQKCPKQTPFPLSNQLQLAPSTHSFEIVVVDAFIKHNVSFCEYFCPVLGELQGVFNKKTFYMFKKYDVKSMNSKN